MIKANISAVRDKIEKASRKTNRNPDSVRLVCVTKGVGIKDIEEAVACGITDIGENRVGDAVLKYKQVGIMASLVRWHMVGHLQTNKVKPALEIFDTIHSLDSLRLAEAIDKRAKVMAKTADCFIEVNTCGESSKYGISPQELEEFIRKAALFSNINIIGLMTIAPLAKNAELNRPYFATLRRLRDEIQRLKLPNVASIKELSMGMSQDFEVAIEEGATFVRIGRAIFN
jgi:pyridoxal phosphate enzyme (YggS family)